MRGLGLTWMERGGGYWVRRVLLGFARLIFVLIAAVLATSALEFVDSYHLVSPWRLLAYLGMALCGLFGLVYGVRTGLTSIRRTEPVQPKPRTLANRLLTTRFVIIIVLPVSGPMLLGFVIGWLPLVSLGRELPEERLARLDLERQRQEIAETLDRDRAEHQKYFGHD